MARRTWRKRTALFAALIAVFAVLVWWVGPKLRRHPPAPEPGDVSLLVLEGIVEPGGVISHYRLVRFTFRDGALLPPELVWAERDYFFHYPSNYEVVDDRYVITEDGGVFDTVTSTIIQHGRATFIERDGDAIITSGWSSNANLKYTALDLKTRRIEPRDPAKYRLPGTRSPAGTMSVEVGGFESTLHRLGQDPQPLGGGFFSEQAIHSSSSGRPPVLWIDDEHFLSQTSNGNLVMVSLDGSRLRVASIPVKKDLVSSPHLYRDCLNRILYECGGEGFVVHPFEQRWERCEFVPFGHGFEADWGGTQLRLNGERIGRLKCWPHWKGRTAATEGYLAIVTGDSDREARVWSAAAEKWFTLDIHADVLVGWVR